MARLADINILLSSRLQRIDALGLVLRKGDAIMGKFLVDVLAAIAAAVIAALIIRHLNV